MIDRPDTRRAAIETSPAPHFADFLFHLIQIVFILRFSFLSSSDAFSVRFGVFNLHQWRYRTLVLQPRESYPSYEVPKIVIFRGVPPKPTGQLSRGAVKVGAGAGAFSEIESKLSKACRLRTRSFSRRSLALACLACWSRRFCFPPSSFLTPSLSSSLR